MVKANNKNVIYDELLKKRNRNFSNYLTVIVLVIIPFVAVLEHLGIDGTLAAIFWLGAALFAFVISKSAALYKKYYWATGTFFIAITSVRSLFIRIIDEDVGAISLLTAVEKYNLRQLLSESPFTWIHPFLLFVALVLIYFELVLLQPNPYEL